MAPETRPRQYGNDKTFNDTKMTSSSVPAEIPSVQITTTNLAETKM